MSGSLRSRVFSGGAWLAAGNVINRGSGLAKAALLGRLLGPADFGLMGIATLILRWIEYFTESGVQAALIQRRGSIDRLLGTAAVIQASRGMVLALGIVLAAPLAGEFFREPRSVAVIRAVALVLLLRGFVNPGVAHLRRELDFRRDVYWRSSGVLVGLLVGIAAALVCRNVWALVWSLVAAQFVETMASYRIAPRAPRFRFVREEAAEIMRFGKWVFWMNLVWYIQLSGDGIIIGRQFGAESLGYYQMAQQLAVIPFQQLATIIRGVMFPAYAQLADEGRAMHEALCRTLWAMGSIFLPVAAVVTCFPGEIVRVVLGPKWEPAAQLLPVLVVGGVIASFIAATNIFFDGVGSPKYSVIVLLVYAVVFVALVIPLALRLGMKGVGWAVAAGTTIAFIVQLKLVSTFVELTLRDIVEAFRLGILGAGGVLCLKTMTIWMVPWLGAVVGICALVAYVESIRRHFLALKRRVA